MSTVHRVTKHERERQLAQRRALKGAKREARREARREGNAAPVDQFPTLAPEAPESAAGVARTLSRDPSHALAALEGSGHE